MKIAIYGEKEVNQIVLTPENDWEKQIINDCKDGKKITIFHGSFYDCRGGWTRQGSTDEGSLIIKFSEPDPTECKHPKTEERFNVSTGLRDKYCPKCNQVVFNLELKDTFKGA